MEVGGLSWEPQIPLPLWWALALLSGAALIWYAHLRPSAVSPQRWVAILFLMMLGVSVVLGILLNPTWVEPVRESGGKPQLSIIVDATESMGTPDADGTQTRFAAASKTALALSQGLGDKFDVRLRSYADTSVSVDDHTLATMAPKGHSTDLAAALQDGLDTDREQGQAVVLLSDGIHNVAGGVDRIFDVLRLARSLDTPIYTRTFGGEIERMDLAVELRTPQDLAFVGQKVPVTARVRHVGMDHGVVDVSLLEGGQEIKRQQVTLLPGAVGETKFWISRDKVGVYAYEVRVAALAGEKSQANNVASYLLRVIDHPIRVLLLEGKPYWDSKFLVRTLSGVPAVELESVVRLSDQRLVCRKWHRADAEGDKADKTDKGDIVTPTVAPTRRDEQWEIAKSPASFLADPASLRNFQVVVFGRSAETFLDDNAVSNLQKWIAKDGGSLLCYTGDPAVQADARLANLSPVHWTRASESRFHVQLTDQGRDLNWLSEGAEQDALAAMPALAADDRIDRTGPLAIVLANKVGPSGDATPALVYQTYGTGRVVVIEGAGMWRWAFLPPQFQDREETYDTLWHSILRWIASGMALMPGQKMSLRVDKISFSTDEAATASVLMRTDAGEKTPSVELTAEDKQPAKTFAAAPFGSQPGAFRVSFGKLPEGRYQVRLLGADANDPTTRSLFDVRNVSAEQLDLQARPDLMARIAGDTGGIPLGDDAAGQILREFGRYHTADRPPQVIRTTAWDRWWVFVGLIGIWTAAWSLRRSGGLI